MIIARSPVRITFAGGGTDIKSYYRLNGGFLIAAGIDKYTWITANRGYYEYIHLKYSKEEKVQKAKEIQHPIFREVFNYTNQIDPIEVISSSDVPVGCGLGSSGSFTTALLNVLYAYQGKHVTQRDIADAACYIEIDRLGEPIGKQDQYATAFGGIKCFTFEKNGYVKVDRLQISEEIADRLCDNLLLFDTGISRRASDVLSKQVEEMEAGGQVINHLNRIKDMALYTKKLLERGRLNDWGSLLNNYWQLRKKVSSKISNPIIDEAYNIARKNGALGGKLQGAGGGGFLMLYCPDTQDRLIDAMENIGMKFMPFCWDYEGAKVRML